MLLHMQGRFQEACAEYECALAKDGVNREAKDGANREAEDGANRGAKDGTNREAEDGVNREAKDGVNREAKDGVNREAEDGANREAKVRLEMAVKAFRVQCECVCLECPFMLSILHPSQ